MTDKIKQQLLSYVNFIIHSDNDYLTYIALLEELPEAAKKDARQKALPTTLGNKFGTKKDFIKYALWLKENKPEYTLHLALNSCKHTGRKAKDVLATRVFCLDLDIEVPESKYEHLLAAAKPHMVIRSTERVVTEGKRKGQKVSKYHFYWKIVSSSEFDLKHWSYIQAGLAAKYRGDSSLADITHLIRVPGFERTTKRGDRFTPTVIYLASPEAAGFQPVSFSNLASPNLPAFGEDIVNQGKAFLKEVRRKIAGQGDVVDKYFDNLSLSDSAVISKPITNANMHIIIDGALWRNRTIFNAIKKATLDTLIKHPDIQSVGRGLVNVETMEAAGVGAASPEAAGNAIPTLNYLKFIKDNGLHKTLYQFAKRINESFILSNKEPLDEFELITAFKQGVSYGVLETIEFITQQNAELDLLENMEGQVMEGNVLQFKADTGKLKKPSKKVGKFAGLEAAGKLGGSEAEGLELEAAIKEKLILTDNPDNDNIFGVSYHKHLQAIQKEIELEPKIKKSLIKYFEVRKSKVKKELWFLNYTEHLKPLYNVLSMFALRCGTDKFKFLVKKDSDFKGDASDYPSTFSYFESEVATREQRQHLFTTVLLPTFREILKADKDAKLGRKLGLKTNDFFDFCQLIAGKAFTGNIGHLAAEGSPQAPGQVVALNGVFSFESKLTFKECYVSPIKYPNIINAKFDPEILAEFKHLINTKFNRQLRYDTGKEMIAQLARDHCPLFLEACSDWFGAEDGEETAITLMAWYGYCFTTNTDFHKLLYMYGASRAGKGTVVRILDMLIGLGNHASFDLKYFKEDSFVFSSSHRKLVIVAEEINTNKFSDHLDFLKKITGDCTYTYNKKFQQPVCEKVTSKVILVSNELGLPNVKDENEALLNRLIPIWFRNTFIGNEKRSLDRDIIKSEGPALATLASLMLALCVKSGRGIPVESRSVKTAMAKVRQQIGDKVWEFLDKFTVEGQHYFTPCTELYNAIYQYEQELDEFSEVDSEFGLGEPSRADQMRYSKSIQNKFKLSDGSVLKKIDGKVARGFNLKMKKKVN